MSPNSTHTHSWNGLEHNLMQGQICVEQRNDGFAYCRRRYKFSFERTSRTRPDTRNHWIIRGSAYRVRDVCYDNVNAWPLHAVLGNNSDGKHATTTTTCVRVRAISLSTNQPGESLELWLHIQYLCAYMRLMNWIWCWFRLIMNFRNVFIDNEWRSGRVEHDANVVRRTWQLHNFHRQKRSTVELWKQLPIADGNGKMVHAHCSEWMSCVNIE